MRKFIIYFILTVFFGIAAYFTFAYYATYSEGVRAGELIKLSHKGVVFKTWEGEISRGITGSHIFTFSVLDSDQKVIDDLNDLQGQYVKVTYKERYKTFPWWGESKHFVVKVEKENSPFTIK
jgi:hypothetical protein